MRGWRKSPGAALAAALLVVAAAGLALRTADAQPVGSPSPSATPPSYADLLTVDRSGEGFVARQLRETRTYPYLDRGNRLLAEGRQGEARAELAAYLERDPGDVKVRYSYGVLLASLGDAKGAERAMTQVLDARPGFAPALLYRATARQKLGHDTQALDDFLAASRGKGLTPQDHARALDAAARVAVALGQTAVALDALRELGTTTPDAERDLMQAQLLADHGDAATALALLARIADSAASPPQLRREALSRRSVLAAAQGRLDEARAAGEAALALDPHDAALLRRLAEIATKQGDDPAALAYLERAAHTDDSPEIKRAEVYAAERTGDTARAADVLRSVLAREGSGSPQAVRDRTSLAILEAKRGRHAVAADLYLDAYRGGGESDPQLLVSAARERVAAGDSRGAIPLYAEALAQRALPAAERAQLAEERGNLELAAGRRDAALASFTLAQQLGRNSWGIDQTRGDLLYAEGDPRAALTAYRDAQRRRDDPRSALGMAYTYTKLGKPGLAVPEMKSALAGTPPLSPQSRRAALAAAGFLYAQLDEHAKAAEAWTAAQSASFAPDLVVPLAREQRLAGDLAAARATLDVLDPQSLPTDERAAYFDERSSIESAAALQLSAEDEAQRRAAGLHVAIGDLQQANGLEPTPDREYRIGLLFVDLGEPEQAIPPLERSVAGSTLVPSHAATLGYAYQDVGHYQDAGEQIGRALAADRDQLALYEDLGNIRVKEIRNDDAIELFDQAIDNTPLYPVHDEQERAAVEARRLRMRRQVSELSRTFSLTAYTGICFGTNNCQVGANTPLSAGASKSQGGVELSVRPPVIGYRDGRVFEVISRVLFEQEVNSIEPRGQTTVITLGVRYKPFPTIDGYLSAERLFAVGSAAQSNVLLRGTYGWQHGYGMQPGVPHWWYTTAYADVARTMQSPQDWFFYAEGRQGVTFNLHDDTMLTPHLYARGRFQTGDGNDFQEVDLGLGIALRWLFREDKYHDFQSSAELLPRIGYDAYNSDGRDLTLSLTAVVRF